MVIKVARITDFASNLCYQIKTYTQGYDMKSRFYLLLDFFIRAPLFMLGGSSHRFSYIADKYLHEIKISNKNGIFKCRKGSIDIWVVSEGLEREVTSYLAKIKSGVFVDIGANIGRYTIKMAKQLENSGQVIAVEADPENYLALMENIKLNNLNNVHAFNMACWDKEEDLTFYMSPIGKKSESSIKREVSDRIVTVRGLPLDDVLAELGVKAVNMVKIDVEGAEKEVLIGMRETIANSKDIEILFEAWDEQYLIDCKKILNSYGLVVDDKEMDESMYRASRPVKKL